MDLLKIIACVILASLPVAVWGYIFYKKNPEDKKILLYTFIGGCLVVFPIMLYQMAFEKELDLFLFKIEFRDMMSFFGKERNPIKSALYMYAFVGIVEEIGKHLVVKFLDDKKLRTIDDAIELSIVSALGFAFVENIMYFISFLQSGDFAWHVFLTAVVFRSIFSTFAHILFSGIHGYFYGIAHFASKELQLHEKENKHVILQIMHKIFHLKTKTIYHEEKMTEGLFIAVALHAGFNVFLHFNMVFIVVPYLMFGYYALSHLMAKKENHKNLNLISHKRTTIWD